jgi:hypothetical protein
VEMGRDCGWRWEAGQAVVWTWLGGEWAMV